MIIEQSSLPVPGSTVLYPTLHPRPQIIVRIAGMSLPLLETLRFEQTLGLVKEISALKDRLALQAPSLSEALYEVIGSLTPEEKPLRYRLLALRRAIFQEKPPKAQDCRTEVLAALPVDLRRSVATWLLQIGKAQEYLQRAEQVFAQELEMKQDRLLHLAQQEQFLHGLLLASKDLYLDLVRCLHSGSKPALDHRLEQGLMNYLTRMAAKTSPYSTFTMSTEGNWTEEGQSVFSYCADSWNHQSVAELNRLTLCQIIAVLATWPEIRSHLSLRVNPTLEQHTQTIRLIRHDQQGGEVQVHLAASPALRSILQVLERSTDRTYGAVLHFLVQHDQRARAHELSRFLDQLIEKGVLQLEYAIPDQSADYLGELLRKLNGFSVEESRVHSVITRLTTIHRNLANYTRLQQAQQRFQIQCQVQQDLKDLYAELGVSEKPDHQLPAKNLFFENTLLPGIQFHCSRPQWQETLDDLGLFQRLLGLYDPLLPAQLALRAFFLEHYQGSVAFLDFYEAFCQAQKKEHQRVEGAGLHQLFKMPFIPATFNLAQILDLEELKHLQALRMSVTRWLHTQPVDEQNTRQLDTAQLANICAGLPAYVRKPRSLAYYCQGLLHDEKPFLVINAIQSGFGRSLGRLRYIARQIASASEGEEHVLPPTTWADPLPVSIQGVLATNINLRVDTLPYEIVYPGSVSERPLTEQLPLSDLKVVDDVATQRLLLFSNRLQRPITPVHMGLMSDLWMPPLYRFLVQAFGEGSTNPLRSLLLLGDPGLADLENTEQPPVIHAPRLCLGRICLSRAYWTLPSAEVPQHEPGESSFEYFFKIHRWRQHLGLPSRCYVRPNAVPSDRDRAAIQSIHSPVLKRFIKKYKPIYIDFENHFSVSMFERLAAKSAFGLFLEEALPTHEDTLFSNGQQSYASEFIIELNEER